MKRTIYWPVVILLIIPTFFSQQSCTSERTDTASDELPNIVVILADDMGMGDLEIYNPDSKIRTPRIDQLGREGVRFTDAHSPSAVCTPTRYGLLTGRYAWRTELKHGVLWGYSPSLIEPGRPTLASILKTRGYTSAAIGKWHLGLGHAKTTDYEKSLRPGPISLGFDYFFGIPASLDMDPYLYVENERPVEMPTQWIGWSGPRREGGTGFWREGLISPGFRHEQVLPDLTEKAVEFIREQKDNPQPFMLYFALTAPHTPWLPVQEFRGSSEAGYYGDFCAQVDWSVGRVLDAIDEIQQTENTLVLYTSDNGSHWTREDIEKFDHRANLSFRGQKADIWEGGHRVPFIARWPRQIPADSQMEQTISLIDTFATVAEIVGIELDRTAGEDSVSILPYLKGDSSYSPPREVLVHHSLHGMFAVREGPWKLILGRGSGGFTYPQRIEPEEGEPRGQLYNLEDDPFESHNLYFEQPQVVERLESLLLKVERQGFSRTN